MGINQSQVFSWQNDICVNVVSEFYDWAFDFHVHCFVSSFLGSVILPVTAEAATVAGEAKYTLAWVLPILPMKFLLDVLTQTSFAASNPMCPPKHGPHAEPQTMAPASVNTSIKPSSNACL